MPRRRTIRSTSARSGASGAARCRSSPAPTPRRSSAPASPATRSRRSPTLTIEKDGNGDPTGVFIEQDLQPLAEMIWFREAAQLLARRPAARAAAVGQGLSRLGTTSIFEGHGVASELLRVYKQAHRDGTLTMRTTLALSANWTAAGDAPLGPVRRGLGRLARRAGLRQRLAQDERALRPHRPQSADNAARLGRALHRLGRLQLQSRPAARPGEGAAAALREKRHPRLLQSPAPAGSACSISTKRSTAQIPLKGRRWVVSHINVVSPRDIERIARMGLVLTTHTNAYLYKALDTTREPPAARAARRDRADERAARGRRHGVACHRQRADLAVATRCSRRSRARITSPSAWWARGRRCRAWRRCAAPP